ncbi:MAG: hypothetical protein HUJ26_00675 [Planctomycetaceae bacterium]|nr:hypothetical protein [Planctomycetaceae bacterium]
MRMETLTKKSLAIFLLGCGISGMTVLPASAQWGWNPFSSKSEAESVPERQPKKSSFFRSPFDLKSPLDFGKEKEEDSGTTPINEMTDRPISDVTRRQIVETSRQYPVQQRQSYIRSFAGLTDQQARERLQQFAVSQEEAGRSSSAGQVNPWSRPPVNAVPANYRTSSPRPAVRTVSESTSVDPKNPFLRQQQGLDAQGSARIADQSRQARPFPTPSQPAVARVPAAKKVSQDADAGTSHGIRVSPAVSRSDQLPIIRPASSKVDTSHYKLDNHPLHHESSSSARLTQTDSNSPIMERSHVQSSSSGKDLSGPELSLLISRAEALAASSVPGTSEESRQQHINRHVDLRLLYLLSGQEERALTAIPGIAPNEQAFWTRTIWALSNYLDHPNYPNKSHRTTVALEQLRNAIQSIQGDAQLVIRNAALCSEIESFGTFTRFEREEFTPGQEILVYCELDNFKSQQTPEGKYRTVLKSAVRLVQAGPDGQPVDLVEYDTTEDLCHTHRTDFMQGYKYRLPERLSPGAYILQLVIEDQTSGKRANYSLNFLVR